MCRKKQEPETGDVITMMMAMVRVDNGEYVGNLDYVEIRT